MHVRDPAVCTFCRVVSAGSLYPVSCSVRGMDFDRIFFILFIGLFTFFVTFDGKWLNGELRIGELYGRVMISES